MTLEENLLWKKILDHPLPPGYYILVLRSASTLMESQPKDPGPCMAEAKSAYKSSVRSTPAQDSTTGDTWQWISQAMVRLACPQCS